MTSAITIGWGSGRYLRMTKWREIHPSFSRLMATNAMFNTTTSLAFSTFRSILMSARTESSAGTLSMSQCAYWRSRRRNSGKHKRTAYGGDLWKSKQARSNNRSSSKNRSWPGSDAISSSSKMEFQIMDRRLVPSLCLSILTRQWSLRGYKT